MIFLNARRLRDKFWPEPLPPPGSFEGQTVLVTGATAGLGLAAAVHFATLGARVIMTTRSLARGESAREYVEQRAGIMGQGKVHLMELDMNLYSSCVSFVNQLKQSEMGLDVAILNAGIINVDFTQSPEGWEQTIQINTLSTTLLGLLLLEWMKHSRRDTTNTPHLVFVTSRDHLDPDITTWTEWSEQPGILRHFSDEDNWPVGQLDPNYAISKLLLTYAVEEICKLAVRRDGSVDIIVNTVCPGLVATDLARDVARSSTLMQFLVPVYQGLLGKSADYGARFYVKAACMGEDGHGKYVQSTFTDEEYQRYASYFLLFQGKD
ncbi:putative short chain dehydrogenase/ reductase [Aspergillus sclerotioniger CBS 115572]|uniref:Putative short chain dehydrogenase/ reductase n=1 Tax=Aspergillus sclerotioniger CBS 115572 TaxID=1450535 RepID=A0A317WD00_9EURO|nr:putative short chain dehydrogenase/ reductase [Aspergillus sclerotioniger CBS 115572]PWY83795.1 putative short chain dehydrogenase/ reductase [Aspergillus sclerotioniger CBS 115572]